MERELCNLVESVEWMSFQKQTHSFPDMKNEKRHVRSNLLNICLIQLLITITYHSNDSIAQFRSTGSMREGESGGTSPGPSSVFLKKKGGAQIAKFCLKYAEFSNISYV